MIGRLVFSFKKSALYVVSTVVSVICTAGALFGSIALAGSLSSKAVIELGRMLEKQERSIDTALSLSVVGIPIFLAGAYGANKIEQQTRPHFPQPDLPNTAPWKNLLKSAQPLWLGGFGLFTIKVDCINTHQATSQNQCY